MPRNSWFSPESTPTAPTIHSRAQNQLKNAVKPPEKLRNRRRCELRRFHTASFAQLKPINILPFFPSFHSYIPLLPRFNRTHFPAKIHNFPAKLKKNTQEHSTSEIKPLFPYVSELQIQLIIYQNDDKNTYYNMESSKQPKQIIYKNS